MSINRRNFIKLLGGATLLTVVPRRVLGGPNHVAPSDQLTKGIIGVGGIGKSKYHFTSDERCRLVAVCDVDRRHLRFFIHELRIVIISSSVRLSRDISVTIKESPGRILSNTPDNLRSLLLTLPLTVSVYHLSILIPFLSAKRTISSRWFSKNCFSVLTLK